MVQKSVDLRQKEKIVLIGNDPKIIDTAVRRVRRDARRLNVDILGVSNIQKVTLKDMETLYGSDYYKIRQKTVRVVGVYADLVKLLLRSDLPEGVYKKLLPEAEIVNYNRADESSMY